MCTSCSPICRPWLQERSRWDSCLAPRSASGIRPEVVALQVQHCDGLHVPPSGQVLQACNPLVSSVTMTPQDALLAIWHSCAAAAGCVLASPWHVCYKALVVGEGLLYAGTSEHPARRRDSQGSYAER